MMFGGITMKTKKIFTFVLAALMMVGVISMPTHVSAASDVDFSLRIAVNGHDQLRVWLDAPTTSDGAPVALPEGTVTWDQTADNWGEDSGNYFIDFAHDFSSDLTFEVTFTPDDTATYNVTTKKFTLYSGAELKAVPTLNDGNISAKVTDARFSHIAVEIVEMKLSDFYEDEITWLLASISNVLNTHTSLNLGTLVVNGTIEPDDIIEEGANIRLYVAGMKEGTLVNVFYFAEPGSADLLKGTTGDGYIDIETNERGMHPFNAPLSIFTYEADITDIDVPATGDDTNIMLYTIIGMMAVAGISFVALRKRVND